MDDQIFRKFENRCIKRELTRFLSTNLSIYELFTLVLFGVGVRCDRMRFSLHSPFIEKSMIYIIEKSEINHSTSDLIRFNLITKLFLYINYASHVLPIIFRSNTCTHLISVYCMCNLVYSVVTGRLCVYFRCLVMQDTNV